MEFELILSFLGFFLTATVLVVAFLYLYAIVTPYDDYNLIFKENNVAAALGFGGAIIGVSIPLYSALEHSVSYVDFAFWGVVAILVQLIFAFLVTRSGVKFSFTEKIEKGDVAVGILMAFLSIAIGLLNAGSMSY
jgi:putative membrane protein